MCYSSYFPLNVQAVINMDFNVDVERQDEIEMLNIGFKI